MVVSLTDSEINNEDSYDDLLVAIEASEGILSLLIAVCDDSNLREQIIKRYETEVEPDIRSYRITLARGEPSLRGAIAQLVQNEEYLQNGGRAVITVTGAEQLYFLKLGAERSKQDIFFGYLQWTREALREFPYPIVLWVTNQIVVNLSKKAPDFWSWRKGVFRFVSKKTAAISSKEIAPLRLALDRNNIDDENPYFLPIEDLQALIYQIEQQRGTKDPILATLYDRMGQIYKRRIERGEAQDYKTEQELAIKYFRKAAELQKELKLEIGLASTLNNLGLLYSNQGRYQEAESLYRGALSLGQRWLGDEHLDVATSLNNLAALCNNQGRYQEAESLLVQALELKQRWLGDEHPDVASSLNNLAALYNNQGRYQEAESLYRGALSLGQRLLGDEHPDVASSLNNLAVLYNNQGRYQEAESLLVQALELRHAC